ncbi:hypothetical protein L3H39_10895, partial [Corynebacterium sp. MC-16]|nr:hypothetical protein [Corynebacterium parakroppenstedtii]
MGRAEQSSILSLVLLFSLLFINILLMVLAGEELGGRGWCTLLCAKVLLPGTTVEFEEALSVLVVVVVVVRAWPDW